MNNSTGSLIANLQNEDGMLAQLPLGSMSSLPIASVHGPSFGGFVGYNYQIDDAVVGLELMFNASRMTVSGTDSETRAYVETIGPTTWNTSESLQTGASVSLADYGTFRARAGWALENFLPYLFLGLSVAQVDTYRYATASYSAYDATPQTLSQGQLTPAHFGPRGGSYTDADISHGKYTFGWSAGIGVDYALTRNIFLRGEFEYLQLSSANDISLNTASVRAGAGLRF